MAFSVASFWLSPSLPVLDSPSHSAYWWLLNPDHTIWSSHRPPGPQDHPLCGNLAHFEKSALHQWLIALMQSNPVCKIISWRYLTGEMLGEDRKSFRISNLIQYWTYPRIPNIPKSKLFDCINGMDIRNPVLKAYLSLTSLILTLFPKP